MVYTNVKYETKNRVGIVTVDRPKALNALNSKTIKEIRSVLAEVKSDESVRVLVITGSGDKAFVAGADIGELKELELQTAFDYARVGHQMNYEIETLGIPTIAAVNGLALGGIALDKTGKGP